MLPIWTTGSLYTTSSSGFWDIVDRFTTLKPIPNTSVWHIDGRMERPCGFLGFERCPYSLPGDADGVMAGLIWNWIWLGKPGGCSNTHLVGMISPDTNTSDSAGTLLGYANFVFPTSFVKMESTGSSNFEIPGGGATMAQELAHNFNGLGDRWQHINCGGPGGLNPNYPYPPCQIDNVGQANHYGFDRRTNSVIAPDGAKDYMSYASPKWVSDYTYRGMFDAIGHTVVGAAGAGVAAPDVNDAADSPETLLRLERLNASPQILLVTGVITESMPAARIDEVAIVPPATVNVAQLESLVAVQVAAEAAGTQAIYTIVFLDANGAVLATEPFTPTPPFEHGAGSVFAVSLPVPDGVRKVQIRSGNQVIVERAGSPNAPVVNVLSPNGGELIAGQLTITWSASDTDGGPLNFIVQYSPDSGTTLAGVDDISQGHELHRPGSDAIPGSTHARVRVIGSDGLNTGQDMSDTDFTLADRAPLAIIAHPANGQTFRLGNEVLVRGNGQDSEDGLLTGANLEWEIDSVPGGPGEELVLSDLAVGSHTARLIARESAGNTTATQVTFTVSVVQAVYLPLILR